MILRRDVDAPVPVANRLVCPTVTKLHLVGLGTEGERCYLDTHADADDRHLTHKIADAPDGACCPLRIARSITDEERIRLYCHYLVGYGIVREDVDIGAARSETLKDMPFYTEIDDRNPFS